MTMATSTIKKTQRINSDTITYSGAKTIPSSGYLSLGTLGTNKVIISLVITSWGANNGSPSLGLGAGNTLYLMGSSGESITDMIVRYTYYDN